ncbi:MAG: MmcQ/YjbR family DNA-binding protein [Corallococcus sp.]|nr:MmcQ/YjbR family DNA-binding protein [Corallococcus sp.]
MDYGFYLKTSTPDFDKLKDYGFCNEKGKYVYKRDLTENGLYVCITITQDSLDLRVIDKAFDDDFLPFSIKNKMSPVKSEAESIVEDIVKTCFVSTDVTQNLIDYLDKKYGKKHETPWDDLPNYYTFKAPNSLKWYAIIMHIPAKRLGLDGENKVDIINFKIASEKIPHLVDNKHYFLSYHMNKKNWITVLLDKYTDTETLKRLIDDSFNMVEKPPKAHRHWLVPANPKYYDVDNAVAENPQNFVWKQGGGICRGDTVYLYIASPSSSVKYKCEVTKTRIPYEYSDKNVSMKYVMQLKLLREYDPPITLDTLKKFGVTTVRGPRSVPEKLIAELNK